MELIGTRLGTLEITALIGRGGMGEVYRARDVKLKREVAVKILPEEFSLDPDRIARFQREAEVLASLNHPNIGAIYDLQEAGGTRFLMLELVEGETLADRISRGPIPMQEALDLAKHICDALEAAHEKGLIHRDLKPANIKVTPQGKVKVLDFGLAKALDSEAAIDVSNSPTLVGGSLPGIVLGTASYMSPEQARGRMVDKRTDIFAFGCVLYEMLVGRRIFGGEDVAEILGRILTTEPDWSLLPQETAPAIHRLLRRSLKKDVRQRVADIRDARHEIEEALTQSGPAPIQRKIARVGFLPIAIAAAIIAVLAVPAVRHWYEVPPPEPPEMHLELTTPPTTDPVSLAISPDGQKILFVATFQGRPTLWLRSLDSATSRPLPGTAGASFPFFGPDNRSIGFFADSVLKLIDVDGGGQKVLATATLPFGPGTWNRDGVILFSPMPGRPIVRVPGGPGTGITEIIQSQESGHVSPRFLPDHRRFLYNVQVGGGIYAASVDGRESKRLIDGGVLPIYIRGHLLFVRDGTLFAQKFDPDRLELSGNPFPIVEQVQTLGVGGTALAASEAGSIVYRSASGNDHSQFIWFDRTGKEVGRVGPGPDSALKISAPSIAPDGSRMALFRVLPDNIDVWLLELARGVSTRFTLNPANDVLPVWSPDGARIIFSSTRKGGVHDLYIKRADGTTEEEPLLSTPQDKVATGWSPDGQSVLFVMYDPKTQNDIWALPMSGSRQPFALVMTPFEERNPQFSPDGKWIAYQSNESGRFEIYIQPFPGPGARTRVSTDGGAQARWRRDGKELFYIALDRRLMAVPLRLPAAGQNIEVGIHAPLMTTHMPVTPEHLDGQQYIVSPDGQRFLINTIAEEGQSPIKLILNWKP